MKKLITIILTMLISASMLLMGCNPNEVLIYAPDGAPALALVSVIDQDFKNTKINIVDMPGYFDFQGETKNLRNHSDRSDCVYFTDSLCYGTNGF